MDLGLVIVSAVAGILLVPAVAILVNEYERLKKFKKRRERKKRLKELRERKLEESIYE